MPPRTQSILPKQSASELAELRRKEAEDDAADAARADSNVSQHTNNEDGQAGLMGQINPFNWLGMSQMAQNASSFATNSTISSSSIVFQPGFSATWGGLSNQGFADNSFPDVVDLNAFGGTESQNDLEPMSPLTTMSQQGLPFTMGPQNRLPLTLTMGPPQELPSMDAIRQRQEFPLTASHDGNFRYANVHDNTLHHHQSISSAGQSGQSHTLSEDNAGNSSISSEGKVAITPLGQQPLPSQPAALAPTPSMGPLSSRVVVPARPKPGRKPLPQEDAQDRRRVQNRMAQRNFRDKRAQKVSELTADLENARLAHQKDNEMNANRIQDHRIRTNNLAAENESLRQQLTEAIQRAEEAERKAHSLDITNRFKAAGFPNAGLQTVGTGTAPLPPMRTSLSGAVADSGHASDNSGPTPSDDPWAENETDMSGLWNNTIRRTNNNVSNNNSNNVHHNNHNNHNAPDAENQWLSSNMDVDRQEGGCGFCTDESNCACIQSQKPQPPPVIAPGGCDACIRDPARAAACKALADRSERIQRPSQPDISNAGAGQRNDSLAQPTGMMSCSNFIDRLGPRMPSISELFPRGSLHSYPPDNSGFGYDVSEQEAAQVLQSMHVTR